MIQHCDTFKVVALCGGVGGAKLAWGLAQILAPEQLTIIVNTGDDFEHLGLRIAPDLDTVMYTLANLANRELGWGLQGETWHCMDALQQLGGDTWFRLGDRDLATHIFRTQQLAQGATLTQITQQLCSKLDIQHRILPMCNEPLPTLVTTEQGTLAFQHYFVREQCKPVVRSVHYHLPANASLSAEVCAALSDPALGHIVICPSNPLLSIAPILAVPGMREQLSQHRTKISVVSPLIGGQAVKGPTAKMMQEMGIPTTTASIAHCYRDLLGRLIIDTQDAQDAADLQEQGIRVAIGHTLMKTDGDKIRLATQCIASH